MAGAKYSECGHVEYAHVIPRSWDHPPSAQTPFPPTPIPPKFSRFFKVFGKSIKKNPDYREYSKHCEITLIFRFCGAKVSKIQVGREGGLGGWWVVILLCEAISLRPIERSQLQQNVIDETPLVCLLFRIWLGAVLHCRLASFSQVTQVHAQLRGLLRRVIQSVRLSVATKRGPCRDAKSDNSYLE
jgi:hypothetical protein